ncbi:MAG: hypothetical protein PHH08_01830 [Candidatus ainarchaeum sp.]|nr:hypothetical protein [Candidatus ainarchaeum sp.]
MNVFRMLVFAVVAIALIYIFFGILPNILQNKDSGELLLNNLKGAQLKEGKPVFLDITFNNSGFSAKQFDTENRSVAFECNNAKICCNASDKCGLIEWDERKISFKDARTILTAARCSFSGGMYACKIYFGSEPAQIGFKKVEAKKTIDLSEEPAEISVELENSGKQPMLSGQLNANVFQKYLEAGTWKKKLFEAASKTMPLNRLLPGERAQMRIPLDILEGNFEIELIAYGENAGSDTNTVALKIIGTESCIANGCDIPRMTNGECRQACYCEACMLGASCEEATKKANPSLSGISAVIPYSGSNKIEFVLKNENCS